jgi:hypothetical protein
LRTVYTDKDAPINENKHTQNLNVKYNGEIIQNKIYEYTGGNIGLQIEFKEESITFYDDYYLMLAIDGVPQEFNADGENGYTKKLEGKAEKTSIDLSFTPVAINNKKDFRVNIILIPKYSGDTYRAVIINENNPVMSSIKFKNINGGSTVETQGNKSELKLKNIDIIPTNAKNGFKYNSCFYEIEDKYDISFECSYEGESGYTAECIAFVLVNGKAVPVFDNNKFKELNISKGNKINITIPKKELSESSDEITFCLIPVKDEWCNFYATSLMLMPVVKEDKKSDTTVIFDEKKIDIKHEENQNENNDCLFSSYVLYRTTYGHLGAILGTSRFKEEKSEYIKAGGDFEQSIGNEKNIVTLMVSITSQLDYKDGKYYYTCNKIIGNTD